MTSPNELEKAQERLSKVCKEQGFKLRARVPANPDDDDLVISDGLCWAERRLAELEAAYRRENELLRDAREERDEALSQLGRCDAHKEEPPPLCDDNTLECLTCAVNERNHVSDELDLVAKERDEAVVLLEEVYELHPSKLIREFLAKIKEEA